ncbi:MAG: hypothetical protein HY872_05690 [Chloroflexi bacterium]|nr:hypothetical protein [Chloroflexota bacterium]MBI5828387.1 hypothetical protein [Chloroflexota bacterium]
MLRFLTGLFLAGVYPVGMKIMATWTKEDRGFGIGMLVGALTLVTIRLVPSLERWVGWQWAFAFLALGPAAGIWAMSALRRLPAASRLALGKG